MSTAVLLPQSDDARIRVSTGPVVAALDDDDNAGSILRRGSLIAGSLGVSLRVAYVWTDCRRPDCAHHRRCHRDLGEAVQLVNALLDEHLPTEPAVPVEREVLHEADPADALIALSAGASVLVVGAASRCLTADRPLGDTARALVGRTRCPVAVIPHQRLSVTHTHW